VLTSGGAGDVIRECGGCSEAMWGLNRGSKLQKTGCALTSIDAKNTSDFLIPQRIRRNVIIERIQDHLIPLARRKTLVIINPNSPIPQSWQTLLVPESSFFHLGKATTREGSPAGVNSGLTDAHFRGCTNHHPFGGVADGLFSRELPHILGRLGLYFPIV
jgi:hypothetical protein